MTIHQSPPWRSSQARRLRALLLGGHWEKNRCMWELNATTATVNKKKYVRLNHRGWCEYLTRWWEEANLCKVKFEISESALSDGFGTKGGIMRLRAALALNWVAFLCSSSSWVWPHIQIVGKDTLFKTKALAKIHNVYYTSWWGGLRRWKEPCSSPPATWPDGIPPFRQSPSWDSKSGARKINKIGREKAIQRWRVTHLNGSVLVSGICWRSGNLGRETSLSTCSSVIRD